MAFYEDMYYSLPENERETFVNSLSDEDRKSLMLALNKNNLCSNISSKHKSRFDSIYNELKDDEIREAFINIFNYLDENKKEIFLDLFFEKIIKCELEYYDSIVFLIKDILTKYKNKLNKFIDSRYFRRILRFNIDIKTLEILREAADFNIKTVYNSHIDNIDSFKLKYNYTNKNNEKLLNMIYKVPEEKRIYFFEEFEKNEEFKDTEFIKMLRIVLDMDKYSFLYVFKNKNYEIYDGIQIDIMTSYIVYIYPYYNNIISHLYSNFKSEAEKVVFSRILNSVIFFKIDELINILNNLDENIQNSFLSVSSYLILEKIHEYMNLFSDNIVQNKETINKYIFNFRTSIDNNVYIEYLSKCKAKLTEISWLIEDFEHAIKEDYKKSCKEIDSVLDRGIENKEKFNKIIEHINNIYKNAYYKKHNKSSLDYIMDDEDENIKYIEYIN